MTFDDIYIIYIYIYKISVRSIQRVERGSALSQHLRTYRICLLSAYSGCRKLAAAWMCINVGMEWAHMALANGLGVPESL